LGKKGFAPKVLFLPYFRCRIWTLGARVKNEDKVNLRRVTNNNTYLHKYY